jgi:hypothetical protein
VALGCATSPPAPKTEAAEADGSRPVTTQLLRDCMGSEKRYLLAKNQNDGHGLGLTAVSLEGKPLWPPSGPACERLIACCTPLASDNNLSMMCQFAVGRDPDCAAARQTVTQIVLEQNKALPPSCRE